MCKARTALWAGYDPQQLATPEAFIRDLHLVWNWYGWRKNLAVGAEPNSGHHAPATLERQTPDFTLVTQNVDGLLARACSRNLVELHGNTLRSESTLDVAGPNDRKDYERSREAPSSATNLPRAA